MAYNICILVYLFRTLYNGNENDIAKQVSPGYNIAILFNVVVANAHEVFVLKKSL